MQTNGQGSSILWLLFVHSIRGGKTMSLSGPVHASIVCEQEGKNEVIVQMFWSHIRPSVTNRHVFVINISKR